MFAAIANPRRAPRIRADLTVDVKYEGDLWQSVTCDFGPGGCSLVSCRPMARDAPVQVLLRSRKLRESLVAEGRVAWATERKAGVAFVASRGADDPGRWFRQLLGTSPELLDEAHRVPDRVRPDEIIARCPAAGWREVALTADERLLLARLDDGASAGALAARTQLAPAALARALYALLDKGVVKRDDGRRPDERLGVAPRSAPAVG
jgi:hypothetical protein